MKKIIVALISVIICVSVGTAFVSCEEDTDCEAVVKVVTFAEKAVPNAKVKLFLVDKNGKEDIRDSGYTDISGTFKATFPLEMVLNIKAQDSLNTALGTIKLEAGESVKKKIYMQPTGIDN